MLKAILQIGKNFNFIIMKKLFLFITMTLSLSLCAQNIALENTSEYTGASANDKYFKDTNGVLNKFLGTWRYQNSATNPTKIFEITFYKETMVDVGGMYKTNELVSKFKYIENGITIIDTYTSNETDYISGSTIYANTLNEMDLSYSEPNVSNLEPDKIPYGKLHIKHFLNLGAPSTLKWKVKFYKDAPNAPILFKIPLTMTLTKIN